MIESVIDSPFRVSIPKRVSEALNQRERLFIIAYSHVSIPKRVSEALNHTVQVSRVRDLSARFNP